MTALKWLLLAVAGYGALLVLMYVFQRSLMYFPDTKRTPPALAGLPQAEEVALRSSDGERLIAWHVPPRAGQKLVIYFQGNAGGLDLRAERFGRLTADGTGVLALCYRGYGGSTGSPSEAGLIRDALAAYDYAVARHPAARIVLWGESLGTGVAVALAAEREVGGVILDAPFSSIADVGAAAYPFAPVRWLIKDPFHSDRRIARVRAPLLIRHGEDDAVVPIRFGERLFALANEPKRFERFAGEGHVITDERGGMDSVRAFLAAD
ncbi:MAG TPA: alpha/beta hydrolase [Pseudolabrys sp.]|nr:alpha/beta hydrolase [Pseudolabrys sp.]